MHKYYKTSNRSEFYTIKFKEQQGVCAICKRPEPLGIDNDTKAGLMRGLLCHKHATGIKMFGADVEIVSNAIRYLQEHQERVRLSKVESRETHIFINTLLNDPSFPSDRARARHLAEVTGCKITTAQTRIRRAAILLRKGLTNS